jgi:hypothetical protein
MAAQRLSIFACLTRGVRNASLPPPALGKRSHGGLACPGIAVRGRAMLVLPKFHEKKGPLAVQAAQQLQTGDLQEDQ